MSEQRKPEPARASRSSADRGGPLPLGDSNENPKGIALGALLREDFRTHDSDLRSPGFWALAVHRFGNWRMGVKPRGLRPPLTLAYRAAYHAVIALFGIDLPYNAKIGRRLRIDHHGCFHLGALRVGDDVRIRHAATIGLASRSAGAHVPTIGDRVEVGPGACIVGGIHVGDDSFVGPNTVLADDLLAGATALGVPARIVDLAQWVEPSMEDAPPTRARNRRRSR